jgi:hypothetical protein
VMALRLVSSNRASAALEDFSKSAWDRRILDGLTMVDCSAKWWNWEHP